MAINNGGVIAQIDDTSELKHRIAASAFAYCHSVDYTATKAATIEKIDSTLSSQQFSLIDGITVHVYFTNTNTAANPTLNINNTGNFPIYKQGTTPPGQTAQTSWKAGSVVSFTYNTKANSSGCWTMNDHLDDNGLVNLKDGSATGSLQGISSTVTNKSYAIAIGDATTASAMRALAEGYKTLASGNPSHAEGQQTTASGSYSHAEGSQTYASASGAHAEGSQTTASVNYAHAEGSQTYASGSAAHAEGSYTTASAAGAHAGGYYTQATTAYQTAIGKFNAQNNDALLLVGNGQYNTRSNAFTVYADGRVASQSSATQPTDLVQLQQLSNLGGLNNLKDGSATGSLYGIGSTISSNSTYAIALGFQTTASGGGAFSCGGANLASGVHAHAEGCMTTASGQQSHTEGWITLASGQGAHAEGYATTASDKWTYAGGYYTQATTAKQTVIGEYNAEDNSALFIVGYGNSGNDRRNALTVHKDGRVTGAANATAASDLVILSQLNAATASIAALTSAQIISAATTGWGETTGVVLNRAEGVSF